MDWWSSTEMPDTANSATGDDAAAGEPQIPSIWPGASDRISQSIGPGVQLPGPVDHGPGLDGEEDAAAALQHPELDQQRLESLGRTLSR